MCSLQGCICLRTRQAAVLPWQVAVCAVDTGMLPPWVSKAHKVSLGADAPRDISCPDFYADACVFCQAVSWVFSLCMSGLKC